MARAPVDQVIVRPITTADADAFHTLVDRERERLKFYFPVTTERCADLRSTVAYVHELMADDAVTRCYLVWLEGATDPVGAVFLKSFDRRVGKCEVAYFTTAAAQGKGVASGAVAWAVDEAFRRLDMQRVFLRVDPGNTASIRVAEKNGFAHEGLLRRDFRTSDDRLLDVAMLAKLR